MFNQINALVEIKKLVTVASANAPKHLSASSSEPNRSATHSETSSPLASFVLLDLVLLDAVLHSDHCRYCLAELSLSYHIRFLKYLYDGKLKVIGNHCSMESLAYIVNRDFILIGVDTNYETELSGLHLKFNNAKKVYVLNEITAISAIGNPYKITDINKYINRLTELSSDIDFNSINEDLKDVFGSSKSEVTNDLIELKNITESFTDPSTGYVDTNKLQNFLKDKPEYISILQDALTGMQNSQPSLSQVIICGWNDQIKRTQFAHYVSLGMNLQGSLLEMQDDFIYTRFSSATMNPTETTKLESECVQSLSPLLQHGWNFDPTEVYKVIDKSKEVLEEGLIKITPYENKPKVVFYELSERTSYQFSEPNILLRKIEYNRNK